jgi:hypothetical protein
MNEIVSDIEEIKQGNGTLCAAVPEVDADETNNADPFPVHCLPGAMRDIVESVSALERTPAGIAACVALGILSSALGPKLRIYSHPGKVCSANLYIMGVAPSGTNKSETFRPIAAPLIKYDAERIEHWKSSEQPRILTEQEIVEGKIKWIRRKLCSTSTSDVPEPLVAELQRLLACQVQLKTEGNPPRFIAENITGEKLNSLLDQNNGCISSISPDGRGVVDVILGRYRKSGTDEDIYIKGFCLEPITSDRVSSGNLTIKEACINVLWLVQPDKLAQMLSKRSLSDGGLLPRFLIYFAEFMPQPIDRHAPTISSEVIDCWDTLIRGLLDTYRLKDASQILTPTPEVIVLMDNHFNSILERRKTELKSLNDYAARWNEQAWRILVVLHAALHDAAAHEHEVSLETAQAAITIADWFARQQLAILGWSKESAQKELQKRVLALVIQKGEEGVVPADVYHKRIAANAEKARELLDNLKEAGLLRVTRAPLPAGGGLINERFFLAH